MPSTGRGAIPLEYAQYVGSTRQFRENLNLGSFGVLIADRLWTGQRHSCLNKHIQNYTRRTKSFLEDNEEET